MRDIRDLREEILTLQSQLESFDVQYRLAEIHERLGEFMGGPTAGAGVKRVADPLVARVVSQHRRS